MSDRSPPSWADALFEQAKAHQECYLAGLQAADENSPSARKLERLIEAVEHAKRHFIVLVAHGEAQNRLLDNGLAILNTAIEEARRS